jgi:putative ABC transport system substrate-binding protein
MRASGKIFALALGALLFALSFSADAQQPGKVFRIGLLEVGNASASAVLVDAFRHELTKLGWIEGKNVTIEYRFAEQKQERLSEFATELVRLKVDVIVGASTGSALAAKRVTATIPIVITNAGDPVAAGLVASLARPGGNVTGNSGLSPQLNTKRLEILTDAIPKLSRVGLLRESRAAIGRALQLKEIRAAALALNLKLEEIETQDAKDLESAFQTAKQKRVGAITMIATRPFLSKENGSSSLPANTGYRLFTSRRSLSMKAVSCPTE